MVLSKFRNPPPKKVLVEIEDQRAFWVVFGVGLEDVVDVGWIGGDDTWDKFGMVIDGCAGRGMGEDLGCPFKKTVPIFQEFL
ncbi:hypothetical protein SLE2022_133640 [Rubroshorea leprosula]